MNDIIGTVNFKITSMTFNEEDFVKVKYSGGLAIYFDKNFHFGNHLGHVRKTRLFPYHKNLLAFLKENPTLKIFFTLNEEVIPFKKYESGYLVNFDSYIQFCRTIQSKTEGRAQAFLGHQIKLSNISVSEEERQEFIEANVTPDNIVSIIEKLDPESKANLIKSLQISVKSESKEESKDIGETEFINALGKFLTDGKVQLAFLKNLPKIQLEVLKNNLAFLTSSLNESESFIQSWIDEDGGKYRRQRCLIFGVEYIDPKREGKINEKRFDVLAEQNRQNHVIIELKSPNAEVFKVTKNDNGNGGYTTEYEISPELARAIPQVLGYKQWYEEASPEEIQALGIESKRNISKCIVVVGKGSDDLVWKDNFYRLKSSINIEIWTYTDLIDKLSNTIKNLESSN